VKNYAMEADAPTVTVTDNKNQKIELCRVKSEKKHGLLSQGRK